MELYEISENYIKIVDGVQLDTNCLNKILIKCKNLERCKINFGLKITNLKIIHFSIIHVETHFIRCI